ncbi:MAG: hypothetical protein HYW49_01120 [Deltaproteobacteria bacterium]|nr:hypothetical protein [Deltaproteobacteria bacterium]
MAPYLAAFERAEPGKHHPAPWAPVSNGMAFDVEIELHLPLSLSLPDWFDRLNTVWLIAALLRLESQTPLMVPAITNLPFAQIPKTKEAVCFWPIEMIPRRLFLTEHRSLTEEHLGWVKKHWLAAGRLFDKNQEFNAALQAIDHASWNQNPSLALIMIWGALERIFCNSTQELGFKLAAFISTFLSESGRERFDMFREIKRLYSERSRAAHGRMDRELEHAQTSYSILRKVLRKIIEDGAVPGGDDLEKRLLAHGLPMQRGEE